MPPLSQPEWSIHASAPGVLSDSVPRGRRPLCAQHARSNPLKYVDDSGHIPILVIGGVILLTKAIDYGWTAWDTYQSGRILADPSTSQSDKTLAGLNTALAVGFEGIEPDDWLPAGLPIDDLARHAVIDGAKKALEEGGEEALERFVRKNLGENADKVLEHLRSAPKASTDPLIKPLGRGSTGRTVAKNLKEQLAMEQAMANPSMGRQLEVPMTDPRWLGSDGWVKMAQNVNDVEIHYVFNTITRMFDDFKFK